MAVDLWSGWHVGPPSAGDRVWVHGGFMSNTGFAEVLGWTLGVWRVRLDNGSELSVNGGLLQPVPALR